MNIMEITGGRRLNGEIRVHGAKNSVLPIMAASILTGGETLITNCPTLTDVDAAIKILRHLGCTVDKAGDSVYIDSSLMTRCQIPTELMREMRSSVIFLGAIMARCGEAVLSMPGGCELGPRPIDLHLDAMRTLGAEIDERGGNLYCKSGMLTGGRIELTTPSVGATENSMIAACGCRGKTVIANAAREPEIRDLAEFLNALGASVIGAGTSIVTIEPDKRVKRVQHRVIPDRIVAATYIAAVCAAGGNITIRDVAPDDMRAVTNVFSAMGAELIIGEHDIAVNVPAKLHAPKPIVTRPYPGFPTDAQPPLMAACLTAVGTSVFVETIFENRYRHVPELRRMGADIRLDGRVAMVSGTCHLQGAEVCATDLRGGAALCVAALASEGVTEISELRHIERGYEELDKALASLGAEVRTL